MKMKSSVLLLTVLAQAACVSAKEAAPAVEALPASEAVAEAAPAGKPQAPVQVSLRAEALPEGTALILAVFAVRAVPEARARFVLPDGARLVEGELERGLGALEARSSTEVRVIVEAPTRGAHFFSAGVDAIMSHGVKLHQGDGLTLGAGTPDQPAPPVDDPGEATLDGATGSRGAAAPAGLENLRAPDGSPARVTRLE